MRFRKIINVIMISVLSISCWEIGKKQLLYLESQTKYKKVIEEKTQVNNIQEYLNQKNYDWITVTNTAIDYPLVTCDDNQFYLTHDHEGEQSISGSIFFDAIDEPYNGNITTIYGHSMRDGTMFNNLHFFRKDTGKFIDSNLIISDEEKDVEYEPLGIAIYDGKDPFYRKIDDSDTETTLKVLKENCHYFRDMNYKEGKHIIALITCEYSIDNGRLAVFYIEK